MCLDKQGKDTTMPMFAIEKDEDYFPEFKECVKESMTAFLEQRQAANPGAYGLADGKADEAIERGLDWIKLAELEDHDYRIYVETKAEVEAKWAAE